MRNWSKTSHLTNFYNVFGKQYTGPVCSRVIIQWRQGWCHPFLLKQTDDRPTLSGLPSDRLSTFLVNSAAKTI